MPCPYISPVTRSKLSAIVQNQKTANPANFAQKMNNIICDFMLSSAIMALFGGTLLMLRLSPNGSFPKPLSPEEERLYIDRWQNGDIEARNILVEHNLRLVAHIIKKYYTQTDDVDDLISIGTIGLIKGINTYKPDKGVRLATYASRCCENEILMHFRSRKKNAGDLSLSDALDTDSEGNSLSLMDIVSNDEELCDKIGNFEICEKLRECIDTVLTEREAKIIKNYQIEFPKNI